MELHKLIQDIHAAVNKNSLLHLPILAVLFGAIKHSKSGSKQERGGLEEIPGDNILPK